jgi:peptidoglycan/LPS O-acetylase OafA/YrhL
MMIGACQAYLPSPGPGLAPGIGLVINNMKWMHRISLTLFLSHFPYLHVLRGQGLDYEWFPNLAVQEPKVASKPHSINGYKKLS